MLKYKVFLSFLLLLSLESCGLDPKQYSSHDLAQLKKVNAYLKGHRVEVEFFILVQDSLFVTLATSNKSLDTTKMHPQIKKEAIDSMSNPMSEMYSRGISTQISSLMKTPGRVEYLSDSFLEQQDLFIKFIGQLESKSSSISTEQQFVQFMSDVKNYLGVYVVHITEEQKKIYEKIRLAMES